MRFRERVIARGGTEATARRISAAQIAANRGTSRISGDFTLKCGGFALGGIGTATFGSILLYALLRGKSGE
jgi:hypothetical protein